MAEVDFSDLDSATAWFEKQSVETRCAMSCRAALRVSANICHIEIKLFNGLALAVFRATLTSAVRGLGRTADVEWLDSAALSAALSADSAASSADFSSIRSAPRTAACSAARSAARSADSAVRSVDAAASAARSAAHSADAAFRSATRYTDTAARPPRSVARSLVVSDAKKSELLESAIPLWGDVDPAAEIGANHISFVKRLDANRDWVFWRNWYLAMWNGTAIDWDFAIEVAKIPDDVWDAGFKAVGARIRELETESAANAKEVKPEEVSFDNVTNLFSRAPIVQASMATVSETLQLRVDAFARLYRPNEQIAFFDTLKSLPETANKIADLVSRDAQKEENQTALALEVGRLRAKVEKLKADLEVANSELKELREKPWYKKSSVLVSGAVISALIGGVWTLSGDDKALEARWNKLAVDLEFLKSKFWPEYDDRILDDLRFELPEIEDA